MKTLLDLLLEKPVNEICWTSHEFFCVFDSFEPFFALVAVLPEPLADQRPRVEVGKKNLVQNFRVLRSTLLKRKVSQINIVKILTLYISFAYVSVKLSSSMIVGNI
jgi:hypothetical protein